MRRLTTRNILNKLLEPLDLKLVVRGDKRRHDNLKILFFHVPKCGGTSLDDAFRSGFGLDNVNERRAPFVLDTDAELRVTQKLDISRSQANRILLAYAVERHRSAYVGGHFFLDDAVVKNLPSDWQFFTALRYPTEHMLSFYYFNRNKPRSSERTTEKDIVEWLDSNAARAAGIAFVRTFVGDPGIAAQLADAPNDSDIMSEAIERATANLKRFAGVADTADFGAFEAKLEREYGVKLQVEKLNKNPAKRYPSFDEHETDVRTKISEICAPNEKVYRALFDGSRR